MTIETKMVTRPVDMSGEFLVFHSEDEKVIDYGTLEEIKETMAISGGEDFSHIKLIPFSPLEDIDIEIKNEVKVAMDDDKYNEEDINFEIYDCERTSKGPIYETEYEDEALEELARLVKESDGREDRFSLYRKVNYLTTYDIEMEKGIIINIPDQEVEVVIEKEVIQSIEEIKSPSIMTDKEIEAELVEMWNRLQLLTEEKNRRIEAQKVHEAFEPDNFMM